MVKERFRSLFIALLIFFFFFPALIIATPYSYLVRFNYDDGNITMLETKLVRAYPGIQAYDGVAKVNAPITIYYDIFPDGIFETKIKGGVKLKNEVNFSVIVPFETEKIEITTLRNSTEITIPAELQAQANAMSEVVEAQSGENKCVQVLGEPSDENRIDKLDIVIVGHNFTEEDLQPGGLFLQNVDDIIHFMFLDNDEEYTWWKTEPFYENLYRINIYYVNETFLFNFTKDPTGCPIPEDETYDAVLEAASNCPFDQVMVIINDQSVRCGIADSVPGTIAYGTNKPDLLGTIGRIFLHEFGHTFGGLVDEYDFGVECNPLQCEWYASHPNCAINFSGSYHTPCPKWAWAVNVPTIPFRIGCYPACGYSNLYSPDNDIMRNSGNTWFHQVNLRHLWTLFDNMPVYAETQLEQGWNLISLPVNLSNMSVSYVLEACEGAGNVLENNIYSYDGSYKIYPYDFTIFELGKAYWVRLDYPCNLSFYGKATRKYRIPLGAAGWKMFGNPVNNPVEVLNSTQFYFIHNGESKGFEDAVSSGWIATPIYAYNNGYVSIPDEISTIEPWNGYWLLTLVDNLTLVLGTGIGSDYELL